MVETFFLSELETNEKCGAPAFGSFCRILKKLSFFGIKRNFRNFYWSKTELILICLTNCSLTKLITLKVGPRTGPNLIKLLLTEIGA